MKTLPDIFKQIRQEIDEFSQSIKICDGYYFNTRNLINKITLYLNSRFESGNKDSRGRRKFFYNIVFFRKDLTKNQIDYDLKDIRILSRKNAAILKAQLFEEMFKSWARKNDFSMLLNEMADQVASYGTTIVKVTTDVKPRVVDLRRLYFQQDAENLQKSKYVIEEHLLTPDELLEGKKKGWKNVDELLARYYEQNWDYIKVYERYGYVPASWVKKGGKDEYIKAMFIVADIDNYVEGKNSTQENGLILFKSEIDKYPYYDFSIRQVKGRLLGVGDVELLLDAQVRWNEIVNQRAVAMEISSKHLFQTQDELVGANFLTDFYDGDIIKANIQPVATESRNLQFWETEQNIWNVLADRLTFSYDVVRGEAIPATTPATNALIQDRNAKSQFRILRQNFGLFLERIIEKVILPKLFKEFNKEQFFELFGDADSIEVLDNLILEEEKKIFILQQLDKTGWYPNQQEIDRFISETTQRLKKNGLIRYFKLPNGFFSDFIPYVVVNATNEMVDVVTEVQNLQTMISTLAANPQAIQDPIISQFIKKMAERIGVSLPQIQKIEEKQQITKGFSALTNPANLPANLEKTSFERSVEQYLNK